MLNNIVILSSVRTDETSIFEDFTERERERERESGGLVRFVRMKVTV